MTPDVVLPRDMRPCAASPTTPPRSRRSLCLSHGCFHPLPGQHTDPRELFRPLSPRASSQRKPPVPSRGRPCCRPFPDVPSAHPFRSEGAFVASYVLCDTRCWSQGTRTCSAPTRVWGKPGAGTPVLAGYVSVILQSGPRPAQQPAPWRSQIVSSSPGGLSHTCWSVRKHTRAVRKTRGPEASVLHTTWTHLDRPPPFELTNSLDLSLRARR